MLWEIVALTCITHVWARGTIFTWLRTHGPRVWVSLADCPLCAGTWIGAIGHILFTLPSAPRVFDVFGMGAAVGTCSLALYGGIRRI